MPKSKVLSLDFPFGGLSEIAAYARQPGDKDRQTSADMLNVRAFDPRSGRRRGGSRSGLSRYFAAKVNGDASIQCLDHVIGAGFQPVAGIGHTLTGGSSGTFRIISTAGSITVTDSTAGATYLMSCWDNQAAGYVVWKDGSENIYVRKITTAGATTWQVQPFTLDSGGSVLGAAELDGILYIWAYDVVGQTNNLTVLYRFDTDDGSAPTTNPWLTENDADIIPRGVGGTVPAHILLAASAGTIALLGKVAGVGTLQVLSAVTGAQVASVTLTSMTTQHDLAADYAGNYYVTASDDSSTYQLKKITSAGTTEWTATGGTIRSASYDPVGVRVFAVGNNVLGNGNSFSVINASTGAQIIDGDPDSETTWHYIRADGLGGAVLGKLNAGDDKLAGVSVLTISPYTITVPWTLTSSSLLVTSMTVNSRDPAATGMSGRFVRGIAVAEGTVKVFDEDGTSTVTNGTNALNPGANVIFSAPSGNGNLFFADGLSQKYYKASTNTMTAWTPTAGSFPQDTAGNRPRLIVNWRARIVLSGILLDPQNWFMTRLGDPFDFDYAADDLTQAVAGNNSDTGIIGDIINTMIPWDADNLVWGCDHSIWQLSGDPMSGGVNQLISDSIGMAWGAPWCMDPYGAVWFFGSRGSVYRMAPRTIPERMSHAIEERLAQVDLANTIVRMAWDDRQQGCCLWLTPLTSTAETTNYFFDARNNAWYPDQFHDTDFNPKAVHVFDGDLPGDRVILIGSWDGQVRKIDGAAEDDDGETVRSHVVYGPIGGRDLDDVLVHDLHAVLASDSDNVVWQVLSGYSAEQALTSVPLAQGTWRCGRNPTSLVRASGHGLYVKLSSRSAWAMEQLTTTVAGTGRIRARN